MTQEPSRFFAGLDLGQAQDFTALAIVGRFTITSGEAKVGASVAKKDLVGAVQVPLQGDRLRFAERWS